MALKAPEARRIPLEELCRLPSFMAPAVSWKGDRVAFYWDKTGRIELYVMDVATREVRQLSHGEVPRAVRAGFVWDRDDQFIVFGKDQDGNEQSDLYRIEVESGQVTRLGDDPRAQEYPVEFSPDNQWLSVLSTKARPETPEQPGQLNLWLVRPDGSDYHPVTNSPFPIGGGGNWSPDGTMISYNTNDNPRELKNADGYVLVNASESRKVFHIKDGSHDLVGDWHPDGKHLAAMSDASGVNRTGVLDVESGEVRWLSPEGIDEMVGGFSQSGRYLVALRNHESQLRPIVYDLETGQGRELKLPAGMAFGVEFLRDDRRLLMTLSGDVARPSLVLYDLESDDVQPLLAPEYGSIDPGVFVEAEHITYPSSDGTQIPALLYKPRDIPAGTRLPAIVHVHGGPTGQWFRGFDPFAQYLVDAGLVVLEPNPRGSTGYGVEFRDAAIRDWGGIDLEDIAAGADYLKSLPYVDPERLVVFGGSYGGYMTYIAMTKKPDYWRAGIAWVGITDLARMYGESMEHFKYFLREQMGDPDEFGPLWADRSAINFADQMTGKLLIIHGINDPRCPISQARVFRDRLLDLGRQEGTDFEYVELAEEGHGSSDIAQKIRSFTLLDDYLARVL